MLHWMHKGLEPEEPFRMKDIVYIITNKGFWLIALLCVLFYSAVSPYQICGRLDGAEI